MIQVWKETADGAMASTDYPTGVEVLTDASYVRVVDGEAKTLALISARRFLWADVAVKA